MAAKARKSAEALKAGGSRHYSKAELDAREAAEVKPLPVAEVLPPRYLPASLRDKFSSLAADLVSMGTMTTVDADTLARYLIAESNYLRCTNRVTAAINTGNTSEADRWVSMQDRYFRQLRAGAADLGLNARARSSITLPAECEAASDDGLFGD